MARTRSRSGYGTGGPSTPAGRWTCRVIGLVLLVGGAISAVVAGISLSHLSDAPTAPGPSTGQLVGLAGGGFAVVFGLGFLSAGFGIARGYGGPRRGGLAGSAAAGTAYGTDYGAGAAGGADGSLGGTFGGFDGGVAAGPDGGAGGFGGGGAGGSADSGGSSF